MCTSSKCQLTPEKKLGGSYNVSSSVAPTSSAAAPHFLHPEAFSVFTCTDSTSQVAMTFEVWDSGSTASSTTDVVNAVNDYISTMEDSTYDQTTSFLYQSGSIVGYLWAGTEVQNLGTVDILNQFVSEINSNGIMDTKFMQYTTGDPAAGFGIIMNTQGDLSTVQDAVKTWSMGESYTGGSQTTTISDALCYYAYASRKTGSDDQSAGPCVYQRVESGVDLGTLCGTTTDAIEIYNPNVNFAALAVGQPICCSEGVPPNFMPPENANGSCAYYTIASGDSCETIYALYYPITLDDLMEFNQDTWNWYGCTTDHPQAGDNICVSPGTPPRPTANPLAQCGPLAPGDLYNSSCPLNACCDQWGFCGETAEFCATTSSPTNAPGTTGCYSNCGIPDLPVAEYPANLGSIAYFLGVDNSSSPLEMDPFDLTEFDRVHYAFVNLNSDWTIDTTSLGQDFQNFLLISNAKVASFGGWDFSTDPSTYDIFRQGVQPANQQVFAQNLVQFLSDNGLEGIDIDWEYPGAPDIPGIPPDDPNNGQNFLTFLQLLKPMMPSGTTLSITLPASYWYLQHFPIYEMQNTVDYFILMSYDYYGQWDWVNGATGIGCHVNETYSISALQMINKAGVSFSKIYGGIGNYARGYELTDASCNTPGCGFTGPASGAFPGPITDTPGFLTNAELPMVADSYTINQNYSDVNSGCQIVVFDDTQWFAYMTPPVQDAWGLMFERYGLAGTSLWAANYINTQQFNESEINDDLIDEYLGDTIVYVDTYDCASISITDLSELGSVDVMCRIEAVISWTIMIGNNATNIVSGYLNDETSFNESYSAYVGYIQQSIMSDYLGWVWQSLGNDDGSDPLYFYCTSSSSDINECISDDTVANDALCSSQTFHGLQIQSSDLSTAASSVSSYLNMTIGTSDFYTPDGLSFTNTNKQATECDTITFTDSTVPSAGALIPNPLDGVNQNNVTAVIQLIEAATSSLGKTSAIDILDSLSPVLVFASLADAADQIYTTGQQIIKEEQEERDELIISIVFGLLSVLTMFVGGVEGAFAAVASSTAQLFADVAVTGEVNPGDIAGVVLDVFGGVFEAFNLGEKFASIANTLRQMKSENSDVEGALENFKYYKEVKDALAPVSCGL